MAGARLRTKAAPRVGIGHGVGIGSSDEGFTVLIARITSARRVMLRCPITSLQDGGVRTT
ncbi:MAG: hypothetical protein WKH64_17295 [Chloroflexia bacterium]